MIIMHVKRENMYTGLKYGNHLVYFSRLTSTWALGPFLQLSRPGKFQIPQFYRSVCTLVSA